MHWTVEERDTQTRDGNIQYPGKRDRDDRYDRSQLLYNFCLAEMGGQEKKEDHE